MRREFLKGYILALISEGALRGAKNPVDAAKRVVDHVSKDAAAVVTDIVGQVAANGLDELKKRASAVHEILGEKVGAVVDRIKAEGFGNFWREMRETYNRGAESMRRD
jgi:hypothetical protein